MWSVIKNSQLQRESNELTPWLMSEGSEVESDTLGGVLVPKLALWGANTQRAYQHQPIDLPHSRIPFRFIQVLCQVKFCVYHVCNREKAMVNGKEYSLLETDKAQCLIQAATEVMENRFFSYKRTLGKSVVDSLSVVDVLSYVEKTEKEGTFEDHFILSQFQTGSGTHTNMNANEVLSRRASQIFREQFLYHDDKEPNIHPNDHANICQSSNDVIPSAMRLCICLQGVDQMSQLQDLRKAWIEQAEVHEGTVKLGRTHLRPATPMLLSKELLGHVENLNAILQQLQQLDHQLAIPIGGTAVGTGLNSFEGYREKLAEQQSFTLQRPVGLTEHCETGMAIHLPMMQYAGVLSTLASFLLKYTLDLRVYMVTGELSMKKLESGSSIMANKSNPTQCESLSQVCSSVLTSLQAIYLNNALGNCQLNAYTPATMHTLFTCMRQLTESLKHFTPLCVEKITYHTQTMFEQADSTLMNATKLNNVLGYEVTTKVAKYAEAHGLSLKDTLVHVLAILSAEEYDQLLNPSLFCQPLSSRQLIIDKYGLGANRHIHLNKRTSAILRAQKSDEEKTQVRSVDSHRKK